MVQAGKPVSGYEFVGRTTELKEISALIDVGQSTAIIAPRRFGKTSLMLRLLRSAKYRNYYTGYTDVFTTPTIEHLAASIVKNVLQNHKLDIVFNKLKDSAGSMLKNAKLRAVINDFEFLLDFSETSRDPYKLLSDALDFIDAYSAKKGKKMLYCFDEFGDIQKLGGDKLLKLIRSKIQLHSNSTYLFSGSFESVMNSIFIEKSSPFFRFARVYHLSYIDYKDLTRFIKRKLSKEKLSVESSFIDNIVEFTYGHPYYTMLALQQVIISYRLYKKLITIRQLRSSLLDIEEHYLEKLWEDQMERQEDALLLLEIAKNPKHIYKGIKDSRINVARALKSLRNSGVIFRLSDRSYKISDPLFEYWIDQKILS